MFSLRTTIQIFSLAYLTTTSAQTASVAGIGAIPDGAANLPDCATPALISVLTTSGCAATDTTCLCAKPDLQSFLANAIDAACSKKSDQDAVKTFAAGFCSGSSSSATTTADSTASTATSTSAGALGTGTAGGNSTTNGTTSAPSYSSPAPTASSTSTTTSAATAAGTGFGTIGALVVAIGALTWVFAEL